jgi:hypothetical protein
VFILARLYATLLLLFASIWPGLINVLIQEFSLNRQPVAKGVSKGA